MTLCSLSLVGSTCVVAMLWYAVHTIFWFFPSRLIGSPFSSVAHAVSSGPPPPVPPLRPMLSPLDLHPLSLLCGPCCLLWTSTSCPSSVAQGAVEYYSEVNLFRYSHLGSLATTIMELVRMQVCVGGCVCVCVCVCVCAHVCMHAHTCTKSTRPKCDPSQ